MSDLENMKYFLVIVVLKFDEGIFINQKKYVKEMLKKIIMCIIQWFQALKFTKITMV